MTVRLTSYSVANEEQLAPAVREQAWFEYLPADVARFVERLLRHIQIYRDFRFGNLAHLVSPTSGVSGRHVTTSA